MSPLSSIPAYSAGLLPQLDRLPGMADATATAVRPARRRPGG